MSRSAVSPRVFQPYSPRRPSPLGLPPFTPRGSHHHQQQQQDHVPCSAYPKTPERYYLQHYAAEPTPSHHGMHFPPEVHRRTTPSGSGSCNSSNSSSSSSSTSTQQQRTTRASPPAPLSLDSQYHPAAIVQVVRLPSIKETQQDATQEMRASPHSPTPSSTSSLSLYSTESAKKTLEIGEEAREGKERKKGGGAGGAVGFCLCFNFSALFGTKPKPDKKILASQAQAQAQVSAEPAPAPQMVQPRRRPASLVLVQ